MLLGELPQHRNTCALAMSAKGQNVVRSSQTNPETGSIKATRNDRCERRIHLGGCGTESKTTVETDLSTATDYGIGAPGISKTLKLTY